METNQTVPIDSDDGCNWLLAENSNGMVPDTLTIWNDIEEDVNRKIDDELGNFRDRLHVILNEQRINSEYLFGIDSGRNNDEELHCQNDSMVPENYSAENHHYYDQLPNQQLYHHNHMENESGLGSFGSESLQCDIDNSSDRSMMSTQNVSEERKNEYIIKMLTATVKIFNALSS